MTERKVTWESQHIDRLTHSERQKIIDNLHPEDDEDDAFLEEELKNAPTLMESPLGVFEKDDRFNPYLQFEFWMLHTNFDISSIEFVIANFHEGVEVVQIQSRYRMLIAFAKMFNGTEVRQTLADKLIHADQYDRDTYLLQRSILTKFKSDIS